MASESLIPNLGAKILQPIKVGTMQLSHRMVLAPLTRTRSTNAHIPPDFAAEYYSQRAGTPGTLLITEATYVVQRAVAYPSSPGVWSDKQIASWEKVSRIRSIRETFFTSCLAHNLYVLL